MELRTERLILREFQPSDWPAVHDYASRPEACRFEPWGPNRPEESQAYVQRCIEMARQEPRKDCSLAAILQATASLVGACSLRLGAEASRAGEIGYIVHPDFWNQGLATEIARALLGAAFEQRGLHRVQATCDPRNVASARVLRKAGMTYEGRLRQTTFIRDGWRDSEMYSILEDEWRSQAHHTAGARQSLL